MLPYMIEPPGVIEQAFNAKYMVQLPPPPYYVRACTWCNDPNWGNTIFYRKHTLIGAARCGHNWGWERYYLEIMETRLKLFFCFFQFFNYRYNRVVQNHNDPIPLRKPIYIHHVPSILYNRFPIYPIC